MSTMTKNFSAAKAAGASPIAKRLVTIHFHLSIFSKVGMPARHGYGFCAGGPPVQDLIAKFQRVKRQVSVPVTEYGHGRRDRNPYGS